MTTRRCSCGSAAAIEALEGLRPRGLREVVPPAGFDHSRRERVDPARASSIASGAIDASSAPFTAASRTVPGKADVYDALKAGASGFLLKSAPPDRVVDAVRVIAAGESLLAPEITRRLIEDFVSRPAGTPSPPPELTEREVEVLRELAAGRSNAEIATTLFLSEATVKTYVARIFQKLGLRDRAQAVVYAYETGLVQPGRHSA